MFITTPSDAAAVFVGPQQQAVQASADVPVLCRCSGTGRGSVLLFPVFLRNCGRIGKGWWGRDGGNSIRFRWQSSLQSVALACSTQQQPIQSNQIALANAALGTFALFIAFLGGLVTPSAACRWRGRCR